MLPDVQAQDWDALHLSNALRSSKAPLSCLCYTQVIWALRQGHLACKKETLKQRHPLNKGRGPGQTVKPEVIGNGIAMIFGPVSTSDPHMMTGLAFKARLERGVLVGSGVDGKLAVFLISQAQPLPKAAGCSRIELVLNSSREPKDSSMAALRSPEGPLFPVGGP